MVVGVSGGEIYLGVVGEDACRPWTCSVGAVRGRVECRSVKEASLWLCVLCCSLVGIQVGAGFGGDRSVSSCEVGVDDLA